jgi:hypothetical protein
MFALLLQCVDKAKPLAYNPSQFWSWSQRIDPSAGFPSDCPPNLAQRRKFDSTQQQDDAVTRLTMAGYP